MMGAERRSMVMTEEEKQLTAYHEAGHALVAAVRVRNPIRSTRPRSFRAAGRWAWSCACRKRDRISISRAKMKADLAVAMGGRIAEELIFGADKVTTGASSDIKMATDIARRMVTEWGMSDKLGPLTYGDNEQEVFLGHSVATHKNVSEATAETDRRGNPRLRRYGLCPGTQNLDRNLENLHTLAKGLLEFETLSGDEIRRCCAANR